MRTTAQSLASHITLLKKDGSSSPSLLYKVLLTLCLLMASVGAWAEDYVLTNGTAWVALVDGSLKKVTTFNESTCVWHCVDALENGNPTTFTTENDESRPVYLYQDYNENKYFLCRTNGFSASLVGTTDAKYAVFQTSAGYVGIRQDQWNVYYIDLSQNWGDAVPQGTADTYAEEYGSSDTNTYSVSLAGGIVGGSIEPSANRAEPGETITLTATPASGYAFVNSTTNWTVKDADNNDVAINIVGDNQCTFTMPEKNVTVSAIFLKVNTITMVTNPPTIWAGNQSLTWTPWAIVSNSLLQSNIGNHLVITYKANNGGVVRFISEDWGWHPQYDANWDINVNNDGFIDKEITQELLDNLNGKNLALVGQNVSVTSIDFADENGDQEIGGTITATVNSNPATYAMEGDVVTLSVEPNAGFKFELWTVTDENGNAVTVTDDTFTMPSGNVKVMAVFSEVQIEPSGYVIYSGETNGEYLGNSKDGTSPFDPKTCIWIGASGSTFYNGTNYLYDDDRILTNTQRSATNCVLNGTEAGETGQTLRFKSNGRYLRYNNGSYLRDRTYASAVVFSVEKETVDELSTAPVISGPNVFAQTGSGEYAHTVAVYRLGYNNYIFYNNTPHYFGKDDNIGYGTQQPQPEVFSYSWSLSGGDTDNGHVKVNATSGKVEYYNYYNDDTDVTLVLTATSANKTFTVEKVITFQYLRVNPNSITVDDSKTLYVGEDYTIDVTLDPVNAYRVLEFSSADESIATVDDKGVVTAKAIGTTSITVQAVTKEDTRLVDLRATIVLTVRDKVAIPEITFTPEVGGLTASTTITTATTGAKIYYTTDDSTPTASSTEYTGSFIVDNLDVVKAIAIMTGDDASYYDNSDIAEQMYSAKKVPTPTINVRGYEVTFSCDESDVTYYYTTDDSEPTTNSAQWDGNAIESTEGTTIKVLATKTGLAPSEVASRTIGTAHVVYLDLNNGNDSNNGLTKEKPKKTWRAAYDILGYGPNAKYLLEQWKNNNLATLYGHNNFNNVIDFSNTVDNNIIYLVGDVSANQLQDLFSVTYWTGSLFDRNVGRNGNDHTPNNYSDCQKNVLDAGFMKPVTISGKYATNGYSTVTIPAGSNTTLNEDTRFEFIEFKAGSNNPGNHDFLQLMCAYYDLEMGEGVRMSNVLSTKQYSSMTGNVKPYDTGYPSGTEVAHFQIFGGYENDCRFGSNTNSERNFEKYLPHPEGFKMVFRSGYYSTICVGGKKWNVTGINGMMGSPDMPVKCTILVDIDHDFNDTHTAGVLSNNGTPDCDLGAILAGNHEGAMYGDVDIVIKSGRIGRVVNGTLGANRTIGNYPVDSYFGRADILVDPREPSTAESSKYPTKNDIVVIKELYGGCLGRSVDGTTVVKAYFYGESSVTINGGTFQSALYASGAGGVNGVGDNANHHTSDERLPYLNGTNINYGNYQSYNGGTKLPVRCRYDRPDINEPDFHKNDAVDPDATIDLSDTKTEIKIHGGFFGSEANPVDGIFGGGYGFANKELVNYEDNNIIPNVQAGSIFGKAGSTASTVTIDGDAVIYGSVYGAGRGTATYFTSSRNDKNNYKELGVVTGDVKLTIGGNAQIHGNVFGAGKGESNANLPDMARLYGNTTLTIGEKAVITGDVYGGGENGSVSGKTTVDLLGGSIDGDVYGGGWGSAALAAYVTGDATTTLNGTIIRGNIFGANNVNGTPQGHVLVDVKKTTPKAADGYHVAAVYGGGNLAAYVPSQATIDANRDYAEVLIENCDNSIKDVFGGGNAASVPNTEVTVWGGQIGRVFAGGNGSSAPADVTTNTHAIIHGGTIKEVYGGSNSQGTIGGTITVDVEEQAYTGHELCPVSVTDLYGGGNMAPYTGNPVVNMKKGTVTNAIYGGGHGATAVVAGNPTVNVSGGALRTVFGGGSEANTSGIATVNVSGGTVSDDVYGGGALADVIGNTSVSLTGGTVKDVYGGGLGRLADADVTAVEALVTGNTLVTLNGSVVTGQVFGANNLNGTPQGSTKVLVQKTAPQPGAADGAYHVKAVYGGGNLAAHIPNDANLATAVSEVVVEGCDNSIEYVYGGGNAASTPATKVTINGGEMDYVFGGGNGKTEGGATTPNPGADVGYKDFTYDDAHAYGKGTTEVNIWGGVINSVFGGSNTKGNIRVSSNVNLDDKTETTHCTFKVGQVYGAGNEAEMYGNGNLVLGCIPGLEEIYGGAKNADIHGDVTVTVTNGTFGKVFGGNNLGGKINGAIIVNIDETGCKPVVIEELYGGGNLADYIAPTDSKYGENAGKFPQVNLISATRIGTVYGAGKGASEGDDAGKGIVTGTPVVNINQIPGLYAARIGKAETDPDGDATRLGEIGTVFGGGNAAKVVGGTIVNIGTVATATHVSGSDKTTEYNAGANITGNVYGGGNQADVTGKTNVTVGRQ